MIRRPTWILLLVFAVIVAGTLVWQRTKKAPTGEATPTSQPRVFEFESDAISRLQLENATQTAVYEKQADSNWLLTGETPVAADSGEVNTRVNNLVGVRALNVINNPPSDTATGLDKPVVILSMTLADGRTIRIDVGAATPTSSGYYARVEGGQVLVINKYIVDGILVLLQNPPLVTPEPTATEGTPVP